MLIFIGLVAVAVPWRGGSALFRVVHAVPRTNADFALPGGRP